MNWTENYNQSKDQITYTFDNGVEVITDRRLRLVTVCSHGDKINTYGLDDFSDTDEYLDFLINTAKHAELCK